MQSGIAGILARWLLPALMAVAVLGMHHLPAREPVPGDAQHGVPAVVNAVSGGPVEASADRAHCCNSPRAIAPEPAHDRPADHGAGHELLHLCLAVLMALAGIVLVFFVVARGAAGYAPRAAIFGDPVVRARPPPLARRLAALGVLRL
ncbi:hypothetical protein [Nocardia sp. CA-290969]|uniref:hypothetical protein n=1 Tax=Nocardia sp. CA-290969 TaxID=3239986 RepID=UPI003D8F07DF